MAEEFLVTLQGGAPWGFRLQGGKEFRSPLRIAKVEPTGKAGTAGVQVGDHVTVINGVSTAELYHTEALSSVKRAGGTLNLSLFRPEGDELSRSMNGLPAQNRTTTVTSRSVISSSGSLGGSIDLSPISGSRSLSSSSELLNGDKPFGERSQESARPYDRYSGYSNEQNQWSPDIINTAVATPSQISIDRQTYSTSSNEDRDDSSLSSQGRSTTLPRRPPTNSSNPPRRLDPDARSRTMPRKSSGGGRTPDWYKQMYKEMHSSMDAGASHLGVLLASDAAKGAFRDYDGATSPGGSRSRSPDTGVGSYGQSSDVIAQRRLSSSTTDFRNNRSAATNPNRKSMPNINSADIPTKPAAPKATKSSWYREMQRGGEIPAAGLSATLPAREKKVMLYNNETREIKQGPPTKARVSRPPPTQPKSSRPQAYEYNNPPDLLDLRRREEAAGYRQQDVDRQQEIEIEQRRSQREKELEEQARVELLRQQEEQEFELERQAELERKRLERERRRQDEERLEEERRNKAERIAEEERQRKIQEQRRKEEIERQEAKRLIDEQRQHEEQRRQNERKRLEEERKREDERRRREEEQREEKRQEDERRRREEEQRQLDIKKREEERQRELERKRKEEEDRQRELQRKEEIRRKEEEERLQAEELKRIQAIENSIKSNDGKPPAKEVQQLAKALYSFRPQSDSELTFRKGDVITVLGQVDDNWYEGELNGAIGIFPATYVEFIEPVKQPEPTPEISMEASPEPQQVEIQIEEGLAKAKYTFKAESPKELAFKKNDMIVLLRQIDENWYEGEAGDKIGIFPLAYVEIINEPRVLDVKSETTKANVSIQSAKHAINGNAQAEIITTTVEQDNFSAPEPQFELDGNMIDKQNGDISMQKGEKHRAKFSYRPMNQDELELREGDSIMVLEKCDDGWFVGTSDRTGQFGTFPGNYVVPV